MKTAEDSPIRKSLFSRILFLFARITAYPVFIIWFRLKVTKPCGYSFRDLNGSIVYSNHASYLDPVLLIHLFPRNRLYFVVNTEVGKNNRFLRWIFSTVGCIMIDKEHFSLASLAEMTDVLKKNNTLVLYPEGQINLNGSITEFHDGMANIALNTGAPVIPVYIHNRKKAGERQVVRIGDCLKPEITGRMPNKTEIHNFTKTAYNMLTELQKSTEGKQ